MIALLVFGQPQATAFPYGRSQFFDWSHQFVSMPFRLTIKTSEENDSQNTRLESASEKEPKPRITVYH